MKKELYKACTWHHTSLEGTEACRIVKGVEKREMKTLDCANETSTDILNEKYN